MNELQKSIIINESINYIWEIKNNYVQNLKGHGFSIHIKEYGDEAFFYFDSFSGDTPNYIYKKVKNILIKKYNLKTIMQ